MGKAIIDHKTEMQSLSECFLKLADAVKRGEMSGEEAVKALLEYADRKTENNCKDEPQTERSE